ncbi:phosphatidate cytidylyltransferase [Epilithonimonas arachidiradicis]|uniref:Phosphatidate cytidylyltransferase n=1 Tax=Epilithonimonas arachidiradicis TaxID=1617282 RepID=A0A420DDL9_9FLAO|nr:phosphatidate cytidylyltransferase [Epilithonimonas arachidiradicis]RKE89882.1 phosphatidate cytidylyltransferase [Epilithonimonas arachidiradicis]GGG46037.1 phosphatidate cytidylyltransferase [Epilithonimonas arachidiradicis]
MDKNLIQRTISGLVYVFVIAICTTPLGEYLLGNIFPDVKQQYLFYGLITFFLVVGLYECIRIMKFDNSLYKWLVFPVAAIIYYRFSKRFFYHGFFFDLNFSEILALALIPIAAITLFKYSRELYFENGKLIFTVIYLALPFGFALGLPKFSTLDPDKPFTLEVFMLFVLIWSSDTFAYLTGKFFGKHKMAPKVSPKKTWEGFAGGVILTLILGFFVEQHFPELRGNWMIVGLLISIFAPLGDLVESQLKRSFAVKDSGNIIPGHGGILDRLDSFIICAPVIYLYFILEKLF